MLVSAILDGQIPPGSPFLSCRALALSLKVACNTVVLAYQDLVEEGFLIRASAAASSSIRKSSAPMSATWRAPCPGSGRAKLEIPLQMPARRPTQCRETGKLAGLSHPLHLRPGGPDPVSALRVAGMFAPGLSVNVVRDWSKDRFADDDPLLIEQIRTRLPAAAFASRPTRSCDGGRPARALYLAALLFDGSTVFGIEDPGYTDARNIAGLHAAGWSG